MSFEKLPAIKKGDLHIGCLTCSTAAYKASMDMIIAVGFGTSYATRDGEIIYDEQNCERDEDFMLVSDVEKLAKEDPDHDWRITMHGPLHGETYQRQGDCEWICIESNQGFA